MTTEEAAANSPSQSESLRLPVASPGLYPTSQCSVSTTFRSPPGSSRQRALRYSPYQRDSSPLRPLEGRPRSPASSRRVMFSPPPDSSSPVLSTSTLIPPNLPRTVASSRSPRSSTTGRSSRTIRSPRTPRTPARSPRTPGSSRRSRASPLKIGRPRDDIWKHYTIERENGKKHGRCNYCGVLKKNGKPSGNLLDHLMKANKCPNVPRDVQISLRPTPPSVPTVTPSQPTAEPSKNEIDQDAFEMALARVFFVCALPFILLEAQVFRDFIALAAPSVKLPSRHKLSMVLLKQVRDEIRSKVIDLINAHTYVSLVTDGWTDTNGSSIINFMVVAPGMPSMFWSSWSTRSKQHTARYFADEIDKVIAEIKQETTAQVVGVVTDNASNMRSASGQVQMRRPNVISGGCAAHVLNLLMQDVSRFTAVKAVVSRAVTVTRFIRDHLALFDEFKRLQQGVREAGMRARNLVLPVPARWYSVHACMRNVLNSQEILEKLFLSSSYETFRDRYRGTPSNRKKLRYVIGLVRDDGFWSSLRTIVRMFDPIIEALRALEADSGFISGVYQWFRWLRYHTAYGVTSPDGEQSQAELAESDLEQESHDQDGAGIGVLSDAAEILSSTFLTENQQQNVTASNLDSRDDDEYTSITTISLDELQTFFREKIQKRWKYVHTNAMAVAFLLDPATNLDDFVGDDDENVDDQVCKLAIRCGMITPANVAKLTAEILKFKCMKRRGGEELRRKYSEACPRDYWGAKDEKNYPLLKMVAAIVFAIPTSSAASERAWSIFDHIHSKRRNRLSVEKIEMLACIYINYGTIRSGEIDLARHQSCPESVDIDHEF